MIETQKTEKALRDGQSHSALADSANPAPQGYNVANRADLKEGE